MQEEKQSIIEESQERMANSQVADSGGKIIFENHVLCSQLFHDYIDMDLLKNISPEDIEDVTERFIPMFTEERDADVVKKVHLSDDNEIFIALIEHKSGVDYNVIMQILRYMVYIWEDYEKQQNKVHEGISGNKQFKYPPVLPIVYYEGKQDWTAAIELKDRITLNEVFKDFIPNFKYYLVSLKDYGRDDLISKKNGLSLVMLINSFKNAEEVKNLDLPEEYLNSLYETSTNDVLKTIAKVISVVLRKQNVPEYEIQNLVDQIERKKYMGLFDDWEGFDVQEERKNGGVMKLISQICKKLIKGKTTNEIIDELECEDEAEEVKTIIEIASQHAPDYDANQIYEEFAKNRQTVETK